MVAPCGHLSVKAWIVSIIGAGPSVDVPSPWDGPAASIAAARAIPTPGARRHRQRELAS